MTRVVESEGLLVIDSPTSRSPSSQRGPAIVTNLGFDFRFFSGSRSIFWSGEVVQMAEGGYSFSTNLTVFFVAIVLMWYSC